MTNALAISGHLTSLPLGELYQLGKVLITTGFLPTAIKTTEQAVAVMLKGQELRIPPMYALSNIAIIQGKPAASAELMLALIYRDHGDDAIQFVETTATAATISYKRRTWKERRELSFTAADAKAAGLAGGNWSKYPSAMLRARCISAVARLAFPDTISGMYTPDELGVETNIETGEYRAPQLVDTRTGEILDAPPTNGASYRPPIETYQNVVETDQMMQQAEQRRRQKMLDRIDELTAKAHAADLEIVLNKPMDEMSEDELIQHGKNLNKALAEHAAQDLTPQRMPEASLPESLADVRQQIAA